MSARKPRLYHALQLAARGTQKIADREIAAHADLTTAQAGVLSVIANGEGDTQRQVAKALGVNESAVVAMVDRLIRLGFLARKRNRSDSRAWTLSIKSRGLAALQATKAPFKRVNALFEHELAPHELEALAAYLKRLVAACERRQGETAPKERSRAGPVSDAVPSAAQLSPEPARSLRRSKPCHRGSCLCGAVRFELDAEPGEFGYCHCTACRKASGSTHGANAPIDRKDFRLVAGTETLREFESSPGKIRSFCARCGSPIYAFLSVSPDVLRIRLGSLDTLFHKQPRAHTWVSERPPWAPIADKLPQFPQWASRKVLHQRGSHQDLTHAPST